MKTVSKKFLKKLANKIDWKIVGSPNFIDIYDKLDGTHLGSILNKICPELVKGEVLKPQAKWHYPIADRVPECGFVWFRHKDSYKSWNKLANPLFEIYAEYVLPDPNNPDNPPKKNWRKK